MIRHETSTHFLRKLIDSILNYQNISFMQYNMEKSALMEIEYITSGTLNVYKFLILWFYNFSNMWDVPTIHFYKTSIMYNYIGMPSAYIFNFLLSLMYCN